MPAQHLTVSSEHESGKCPDCGMATILVAAPGEWDHLGEDLRARGPLSVYINEEVTGHYCERCEKLTSLSVNRPR